ncbi:MAG: sugar phosphate nucleotidyltransferase [bacterium]|nr:sugar phosphate nucleotidyltransferase [bacterium]
MKAIVPAAGIGKRLQPLTYFQPKPLLWLGKKRMIDYIMDTLLEVNLSEIIVITGYKKDMLEEHLIKNYRQNFTFVCQKEQAGLGDAINLGIENSKTEENEDLLVLLSDTIVDVDMKKFTSGKKTKIAVKKVDDPRFFGIVNVEGRKITDMEEKPDFPKSNLAIVGLYYFSSIERLKNSLNHVKDSGKRTKNEFQLTDAMKHLLEQGEIMEAFKLKSWIDCGNFEMFIDSNRELLKKSKLKNYFEKADVVDSDIQSNVSLFENVKVINSKLKNTVVFPGCTIENSVITDSIIGEGSRIENFKGKVICSDKTILKK